jgi:hypothetical protein
MNDEREKILYEQLHESNEQLKLSIDALTKFSEKYDSIIEGLAEVKLAIEKER